MSLTPKLPSNYSTVILDIEGTTTPISFVHDVMFPYVLNNIHKFLQTNWGQPDLEQCVADLIKQAETDKSNSVDGVVGIDPSAEKTVLQNQIINNVTWQMAQDRKIAALKNLQGLIWKDGFHNGSLKGIVYNDAFKAITTWKENGKSLYIYSSGSVAAQKLLFGHSNQGDMLENFSGHFDTTVGNKLEAESYVKISNDIGVDPKDILFVSDNLKEIKAAESIGMQVVVSVREGNAPILPKDEEKFFLCSDFTKLL
ncbi:enolase-phosphatase E1 [Mycoemilia scoparia]|uniref:Enolase-phosphatase E1 n=1 Tax=Mycoemilia scoparia TaxID=417184 RepID=A0A9W8A570_9FUNG|nr:enolase-phosphatase E1 [Mycoemilia scoparia]